MAEIFQIVEVRKGLYQVSVRELLGPYAMTHSITSYLTHNRPEEGEIKSNKPLEPTKKPYRSV